MIDALYIVAEDAIRTKNVEAMITEGQPVALNAAGELIAATDTTGVFGVSKLDSNAFRNFAFGEFGAFGTGKLTVVQKGTIRVKDSVYNEIEIDTQTGINNAPIPVQVLADVEWHVNDLCYVTAGGLISNVPAGKAFGRVLSWDNVSKWLEIEVDSTANVVPSGPTGA